ncbi:MAG: PKD domain-containing protein [Acidobacteria bacterium]|nr:MAG: PKD domain-containing protein [Acidobacteriota bacterium]
MTSGYRAIGDRVIGIGLLGLLAIGLVSCRVGKVTEPDLAGPSGFGVSLGISASPDLLQRDGRTTSTVTISAFNGASKPMPGLGLHLDLRLEGGTGGLGTLSQRDIATGADGRVVVTYTSPLPAPLGQSDEATVQIIVTPVGTNAANTTAQAISIRLTSPDQAGGPTASFVAAPRSPKVGDTILFDASTSIASPGNTITSWAWDFGDGNASPRVPYVTSSGPTITHEYNKSGTFSVGLTVIDSAGRRANATLTLVLQ